MNNKDEDIISICHEIIQANNFLFHAFNEFQTTIDKLNNIVEPDGEWAEYSEIREKILEQLKEE
jgi:hypothetical protein